MMLESPLSWILTASRSVKVSFLQGFFESAAKIDKGRRRVEVGVSPINAPIVLRLLLEVGVHPLSSCSESPEFAVSMEDAARVPLFSPRASAKLSRVISLLDDGKHGESSHIPSAPR
jgi:hypothetical protein